AGVLVVRCGRAGRGRIVRSRARQLHPGIGYHHQSPVDHVDVAGRRVHLDNGASLPYEVLVIATGAALLPGETEGLAEAVAQDKAVSFYEPRGAAALREALAGFDGGLIAINVADMPIKGPGAPIG